MIRAIVDEVIPMDLVSLLSDQRATVDAFPESWRGLSDAAVIANAIAGGYAWLITCDKHMAAFQQNLTGSAVAVLVLPTARVPELRRIERNVRAILQEPVPGNFVLLDGDGSPIGIPAPYFLGQAKRTD